MNHFWRFLNFKVSQYFIKFDFCKVNILPFEKFNKSGTGVNGYDKTSIELIFFL